MPTSVQVIVEQRLTGNAAIMTAEWWGEPPRRAARPTGTTRCQRVAAYGLAPDTPEPEIVAHLFKLYAEKTSRDGQNP